MEAEPVTTLSQLQLLNLQIESLSTFDTPWASDSMLAQVCEREEGGAKRPY